MSNMHVAGLELELAIPVSEENHDIPHQWWQGNKCSGYKFVMCILSARESK